MRKNFFFAVILLCSVASFGTGCQLSTGDVVMDGLLGMNQPVRKTVKKRQITRSELEVLIQNQRRPDLLIYRGSKDGLDYFTSRHMIVSGSKPNQHIRAEDSDYWISSTEAGLPNHLPYGQEIFYDVFVGRFKPEVQHLSG